MRRQPVASYELQWQEHSTECELLRRNCVGQNFANVSMLTFLATLLGRFTFRLADQASPRPQLIATGSTAQRSQGLRSFRSNRKLWRIECTSDHACGAV